MALHQAGMLDVYGDMKGLFDSDAFATRMAPFRKTKWVVRAKRPFGGRKSPTRKQLGDFRGLRFCAVD